MATDGRTDDDGRTDGWILVFHNTLFNKNTYYDFKSLIRMKFKKRLLLPKNDFKSHLKKNVYYALKVSSALDEV